MCRKSELGKAVGKNRINRLNDNNSLLKVFTEAALQEVFLRKGILKYAANLQENTHAEVRVQRAIAKELY